MSLRFGNKKWLLLCAAAGVTLFQAGGCATTLADIAVQLALNTVLNALLAALVGGGAAAA